MATNTLILPRIQAQALQILKGTDSTVKKMQNGHFVRNSNTSSKTEIIK